MGYKLVRATLAAIVLLLGLLILAVVLIQPTLAQVVAAPLPTGDAANGTTLFHIPPAVWAEVNELLIGLFIAVGTLIWKWIDAHSPLKQTQAEEIARNAFQGILCSAAKYGASQLQATETKVGDIDVGNSTVASAANYAIAHAPDLAKKLGIDVTTAEGQAAVIRAVTARLADVLAVPQMAPALTTGAPPTIVGKTPADIPLPASVQPPAAPSQK